MLAGLVLGCRQESFGEKHVRVRKESPILGEKSITTECDPTQVVMERYDENDDSVAHQPAGSPRWIIIDSLCLLLVINCSVNVVS